MRPGQNNPLSGIRWPLSRATNIQELASGTGRKFLQFVKSRTFIVLLYVLIATTFLTVLAVNMKFVQVTDDSGSRMICTFQSNPVQVLKQSGIYLSSDDRYSFSGYKNNYGTIRFHSAFPVNVTVDGKTKQVMASGGSVADVLKKGGISLGVDDLVNVPANKTITKGMQISISRVRFENSTVQSSIPHETTTVQDDSRPVGTTTVVDNGQDGIQTMTYRVKYVDGVKKEQAQVAASTVQPVNAKVLVGSASPLRPSAKTDTLKAADSAADGEKSSSAAADTTAKSANGVPGSYKKVITGVATAYTQDPGTQTSTGKAVTKGLVAVDPNKIPYGTKLYIASADGSYVYGTAVAADTGGFVHNGSGVLTDLFLPTEAQCEAFGRRTVNMYVLA
ncbi:MAG TPA: hypothetical protein DEP42_01305 [Ruminococcaceae bacterium]|nr:hypothetical protein [Oscillospiraceae bacterium]